MGNMIRDRQTQPTAVGVIAGPRTSSRFVSHMRATPPELLPEALQREMAKRGLTKITSTARIIGVGKRDLRRVLGRQRRPNKRTFAKYAKFLNMSTDAIEALVEGESPAKGSFIYSDEVDAALRAIQDAAVQKVVGAIRPDLVRALSALSPPDQSLALTFVNRLTARAAAAPKEPVKLKPQAPSKPKKRARS